VLDVVDPSEDIRELDLFKVFQLVRELGSKRGEDDDVSYCDVCRHKEHALSQVLVELLCQILG